MDALASKKHFLTVVILAVVSSMSSVKLVVNTYSSLLTIRVQRLPASVMRMLLGQEVKIQRRTSCNWIFISLCRETTGNVMPKSGMSGV